MRTFLPPTPEQVLETHAEDPDRPGTCRACTTLGVSGPGEATVYPCAPYRHAKVGMDLAPRWSEPTG
jgi:hypothetical protein